MGKASKRKTRPPGGVPTDPHASILAESQRVRETPNHGIKDAAQTPALEALLESARLAIGESVPTRVMHEGRPYWVRLSIGLARLEVFAAPSNGAPLVTGYVGSVETFGHQPAH